MKNLQHIGIYITGNVDTNWLVTEITNGTLFDFTPQLQGLHGEIFSALSLQQLIDEEIRHGQIRITTGNTNPLSTSSNGEQRRALLSHIIMKKPRYIVADNIFESLDIHACKTILLNLEEIAANTIIIQVINRKKDCLPFISRVYSVEGNRILSKQTAQSFLQLADDNHIFGSTIPGTLNFYANQNDPLVKMNNVCVQFNGRKVLQNICWEINTGEFWQLAGPNGSGKSTLLALITGDSPKGYGQNLELFGKQKGSGETVWQVKEKIGYFTPGLAQQFERQDSLEKMIIGGFYDSIGLYIRPTDMQVKLAHEWLKLIGLFAGRHQLFRNLTLVQKRMILIARAMVKGPPLLILDEPVSGLDDQGAAIFVTLVNKIASETDTAIIYVSHRNESDLSPDYIYELVPTSNGSIGIIPPS